METKLREVKQLLDERGWIKGDYASVVGFCLVGAIHEVTKDAHYAIEAGATPESELIDGVVSEQFPYFTGCLPDFNDADETTRADIDMILEKAILKAEEIV